MYSHILLIFFVLISSCYSLPPQLLSATQYEKSATILGGEQRYITYELDFDQDLYYQENWPCPCTTQGVKNCTSVPFSSSEVNETGYNITILKKDEYIYRETNFTELTYYKFDINISDFTECPIIYVDLQSIYGQMQLLISNDGIPTLYNYQWYKYQLQRDSVWICSTDPRFKWGTWYITVQNAAPVTLRNAYRIKWSVVSKSNTCRGNIGNSRSQPIQVNNSMQLQDGIAHYSKLPLLLYEYYHYFPTTVCIDYSMSARQSDPLQEGDVDIYMSLSDPYTSFETGYDYSAYINHDDSMALRSLCSPTGKLSDFVIYSAVQTWKGDMVQVMVVATETYTFISRPVTELPPQGLFNSLTGSTFELSCSNSDTSDVVQEEVFYCQFPAHIYCMEPQAPYQCCSPLMAIPPTESANPLWPSLRAFRDLEFSRQLPWDLPSYTEAQNNWSNIPKRLTLAILRDVRYSNELRKFVQNENMNNCTLKWKHNFANYAGEPIQKLVTFTNKQLNCNYVKFKEYLTRANQLIQNMEETLDYSKLQMYHLQLQILMIDDVVLGCKKYIDQLFKIKNQSIDYLNQYQCYNYRYTVEYDYDPCCTYMGTLHKCCEDKNITIYRQSLDEIKDTPVECLQPECSAAVLNQYLQDNSLINNRTKGCTSQWDTIASSDVVSSLTDFIAQCRNDLLGYYDMQGITCTNNLDCQYGVECNLITKKCLHNDSHVIQCWIDNMDIELQQSLFNYWKIQQPVTTPSLYQEIYNRIMTPNCVGPGSLHFRDHWFWDTMASDCHDVCTDNNLAPLCFENDPMKCPIPAECPEASESSCFHWWTFIGVTPQEINECTTSQGCNWKIPSSCSSRNLTDSECITDCNVGTPVCLSCDGTECYDTDFNQTECNIGLCSINFTIHDVSLCESSGVCSLGTLKDKIECENNGICTDSGLLQDSCFSPFQPDFYGTPYCGGLNPEFEFGCLVPNITDKSSCESQSDEWGNYLWVESGNKLTNQNSCTSASENQCFNDPYGLWVKMDQKDCNLCGLNYEGTLNWEQGVWTVGKIIKLEWTIRQVQPLRQIQNSLDYLLFYQEISQAIMSKVSLAFSTESICRNVPILNAIGQLTCDCLDKQSTCYNSTSNKLGVGRACPFIESNINLGDVTLHIFNDTLYYNESCKPIYVSKYSSSQYQQQPVSRISSDLFITRSPNVLAIVRDTSNQIVGQIVSDGFGITWSGIQGTNLPLYICILIDPNNQIDSNFDKIALSYKNDQGVVVVYSDAEIIDNSICGYIEQPGVYFGSKIASNSSILTQNIQSTANWGYSACFLYGILIIITVIQLVRICKRNKSSPVIKVKIMALIITLIFSIVRTINMSVFTLPWYVGTTGIDIILLVEIPTILFYVMYFSIIYVWFKIIISTNKLKNNISDTTIIKGYLITNMTVLILFIIFMITYYVITEDILPPCKSTLTTSRPKHHIVNVAYLLFMSILSTVITIIYIVVGTKFLKELRREKIMQRKDLIIMTSLILTSFSILFIIRSIVILWSAVTNAVLPVIVYVLLEFLPSLVMLYYINPIYKTKNIRHNSSNFQLPSNMSNDTDTNTNAVVTNNSGVSTASTIS
jgi:hypothetical protein